MSQIECRSCHAMMPSGTKFCTSCGARIDPLVPPEPEQQPAAEPEPAFGTGREYDVAPAADADDTRQEHGWLPADGLPSAEMRPPPPANPARPQTPSGYSPSYSGAVQYDPAVIQSFADGMYRMADSIVLYSTIIGAIIGGIVGFGLGMVAGNGAGTLAALLGLAVGGFIGNSRGQSRTFALRLAAQQALCQVEIELNTRSLRP